MYRQNRRGQPATASGNASRQFRAQVSRSPSGMLRKSRIQDHNPDALNQTSGNHSLQRLYEDNVIAIYRFIYAKVGNREEAEDLTSQVFMKALRSLDQERDLPSIQVWLFQVARTVVVDHWRVFYPLRANALDDPLDARSVSPLAAAPTTPGRVCTVD